MTLTKAIRRTIWHLKTPARVLRRRSILVDHIAESVEFELKLLRTNPVIIYSMGKAGTTALTDALRNSAEVPVVKVHALTAPGIRDKFDEHRRSGSTDRPRGYWRYPVLSWDLRVRCRRVRYIISAVREPVARVVSGYFYSLLEADRAEPIEVHGRRVENELRSQLRARDWFDRELKTVTDINVYASPFPTEDGYAEFTAGRFRTLVIRQENLRDVAPPALRSFLSLPEMPELPDSNRASDRDSADLYARFLREWTFDEALLDEAYRTKQARHFYTPDEIGGFKKRWSTTDAADE